MREAVLTSIPWLSTTSTFPISFHSSASASAASLITSPYIVNSSQTIYAKITNTNPFCENIKAIDITVLPNVQVNVSDGEVCQNQGLNLSNLTVSPPSPGIWSGNGISNNVFTSPTPGTFNLTFTPSTQCYLADDVAIEVLPQPTISLGHQLYVTSVEFFNYPTYKILLFRRDNGRELTFQMEHLIPQDYKAIIRLPSLLLPNTCVHSLPQRR